MITTADLGRKMMTEACHLDDDNEFVKWARLAPKLISIGAPVGPRSVKDLSPEEQQVMARALNTLLTKKASAHSDSK